MPNTAPEATTELSTTDLIAREIWKNTEATLNEAQDIAAECLNALMNAGFVVVKAEKVMPT
jgi:hypothetical protein